MVILHQYQFDQRLYIFRYTCGERFDSEQTVKSIAITPTQKKSANYGHKPKSADASLIIQYLSVDPFAWVFLPDLKPKCHFRNAPCCFARQYRKII